MINIPFKQPKPRITRKHKQINLELENPAPLTSVLSTKRNQTLIKRVSQFQELE